MTERQAAIVEYVRWHHATLGYAPSVAEIGAAVGYRSRGTTLVAMRRLRELGLLKFEDGRNRTTRLAA